MLQKSQDLHIQSQKHSHILVKITEFNKPLNTHKFCENFACTALHTQETKYSSPDQIKSHTEQCTYSEHSTTA